MTREKIRRTFLCWKKFFFSGFVQSSFRPKNATLSCTSSLYRVNVIVNRGLYTLRLMTTVYKTTVHILQPTYFTTI